MHSGSLTLLDLPDELLISCLPWEGEDPQHNLVSVRPCIAVCKRILGVLLKGSKWGTLGLRLQICQSEDISIGRSRLQLLCQGLPNLHKLQIHSQRAWLQEDMATLLSVPKGDGQSVPGWLTGITQMWLGALEQEANTPPLLHLPHPVLHSVATACPNLKALTLSDILLGATELQQQFVGSVGPQPLRVMNLSQQQSDAKQQPYTVGARNSGMGAPYQQQPSAMPATLPHLQHLKLIRCRLHSRVRAFKQQLQMLPELHELSMVTSDFMTDGQQWRCTEAGADSVAGQLTSLEWDDLDAAYMSALIGSPYAQLQRVCVPDTVIDDSILKCLLEQAPRLTMVHVAGFHLTEDFSHRQCSWDSVVMAKSVDIASLARLPLSNAPKLLTACTSMDVRLAMAEGSTAAEDLQLTAAAAAAVERCGGIQPVRGVHSGSIRIEVLTEEQPGEVLEATFPMLHNITKGLTFQFVHVTAGTLRAINNHLPQCSNIIFGMGCTFEEGVIGDMVPLLQHASSICLITDAATLQQLSALCAAATHSVLLLLPDSQYNAWHTALNNVIRDAGHGYVELATFGADIGEENAEADNEEIEWEDEVGQEGGEEGQEGEGGYGEEQG